MSASTSFGVIRAPRAFSRHLRTATIAAAVVIAAAVPCRAVSAQRSAEGAGWAISLGFGSGSSESDWFRTHYYHETPVLTVDGSGPRFTVPDFTGALGGLNLMLNVTRRTAIAPSRLRLGGEVGIGLIRHGTSTTSWGGGGFVCVANCSTSPPDDAAIHVHALAAVALVSTERVSVRTDLGGGFTYFNVHPEYQAYSNPVTMASVRPEKPGTEPSVSARLVTEIKFPSSGAAYFALEPYITVAQTLGTAGLRATNFGLAVRVAGP